VERLRIKESDRIATTIEMLENLGGISEYSERIIQIKDKKLSRPGLYIAPVRNFTGGTVNAHNDHRIAMAAAIATIRSTAPVTILGAECVEKSYPDFWRVYRSL
jgi:3-phosphoshikimate 1-carboxyvinyltransferase